MGDETFVGVIVILMSRSLVKKYSLGQLFSLDLLSPNNRITKFSI